MSSLEICPRVNSLSNIIKEYWTYRAPSYSDVVKYELSHENEDNWMKVITSHIPKEKHPRVLDVGTGPGFFATALAKRGYIVTAVDFNEGKAKEFEKSQREVLESGVFNYNDYSESDKMEDISKQLILSRHNRPEADITMLNKAGFEKISCDWRIGEDVWDDIEKINYSSTPMFMLKAEK